MTLNWNATAPDCQVVLAIAPLLDDVLHVRPDATWGTPPNRLGQSFKVTNVDVDDLIHQAVRQLPDTPYWRRTRNRALTKHGLYQIRRDLNYYMSKRPRGYQCLCGKSECRYPQPS